MIVPQYILKCTKAQDNQATHLHFIMVFVKCAKRRKSKPPEPPKQRKKKIKLKFEGLYFPITLLKFGMWGPEGGGHLQYKNDSNPRRSYIWT